MTILYDSNHFERPAVQLSKNINSFQIQVAREALLCVQKLMLQKAVDLSAAVAAA